ncbi:hypothetical protein [Fictibacillus barbaricus]|uniref:Lipopolysaccharide export LptBFGC system permease protein LptF n=1 Tax=Fictibacillus barbaricus TaxID=182136 RepID=A0ABU1TXI5_9BACL|nr:hypothetical protein [Fictibacillus barbaricus]MDR7071926.1 lipopolysaccharide export LptBFGC system permease protein LptF [Fictibacillus barbaricus]
MKNYGLWSIILVVVGLFLSIEPFSPLNLPIITNWYGVLIGAIIYIIGFVLSIAAIVKKEKGVIKYISLVSFVLAIYFIVTLFNFIGTV